MPFATALRDFLLTRQSQVPAELANGDNLERVLGRYLLAVEAAAGRELLTSILLLDREGQRLWHGAAPNLPPDYLRAVDGGEIGPRAGSCGTAAYLGRPVYVTDIATDPLWADYRDLAGAHGLRACWSTPIRDDAGAVIGTFAIYHRDVGGPAASEIEAIEMISDHVAHAIQCARDNQQARASGVASARPPLRLVGDEAVADAPAQWFDGLLHILDRLQSHAIELDRCADMDESEPMTESLRVAAADCRKFIAVIRGQIQAYECAGLGKE